MDLISTLKKKIVRDYATLGVIAQGLRAAGYRIVVTIG